MKIKKYTAPTMPEAMQQIRRDLGTDAVILNSREVQKGGIFGFFSKKHLEVIAAIDPGSASSHVSGTETSSPGNGISAPREAGIPDLSRLQGDLRRLRISAYPEPLAEFHDLLREQEVEEGLSEKLMKPLLKAWYESDESLDLHTVRESFFTFIAGKLAEKQVRESDFFEKKYLLLVGPTGVGKTTTLAKLAAKAKLEERKSVAFITADTYRIAAVEQLKTYADILNVPIEIVYTPEDFRKAKASFSDRDLVLVDSAGRNYRQASYVDELKQLIPFEGDMETWLVLSLTSRYDDMKEILGRFSEFSIDRCVLTKLDESRTCGAAVNLWLNDGLIPAFFTNGQNVPDDLLAADHKSLARWVTEVRRDA
ncbi:MAG TPA: flagellar biosynthesis protein FlhF [Bacillales bacterium]|nr:flagellar biosynthesis protein FlhF [Bacillales bacterium]